MSRKALRVSLFRVRAGALLAILALWPGQGVGGEVTISRDVAVHGQDLVSQLAQPVAEMTQQLTSLGCSQFSVAYWSGVIPAQPRVEVRCRGWLGDVPPAPRRPSSTFGAGTRRATHESTVEGPPR